MKKELLVLKKLTIEGAERSNMLHDIDLVLRESECFCLVSTVHQKEVLVEYLQGSGRRISGSIRVQGHELALEDRKTLEKNRVFVISRSTPYMSTLNIGENLFLLRRNSLKKILINERAIRSQAEYYFDKYRIGLDPSAMPEQLRTADKILIGIIRSVSQGARLIVLSDTSGAFSRKELCRLTELILELKKEGIGILISDNNPEAFYSVTDRIVIFKHGRIAKKIYEQEQFPLAPEIVLRGMKAPKGDLKQREKEGASIEINGLYVDGKSRRIRAARGEIILLPGEAAPVESLWEQFWRLGERRPEFLIGGKKVSYRTMSDLVKNRIAMVSFEIPAAGVMGNLTREDNILMPSYQKISTRLGFYHKAAAYIMRDNFLFEDGVSIEDIDMMKNGWKLVLYRWKLFNPRLLIIHNCITAVDLQERDWIKRQLTEMAARGTAVILLENEAAFCSGFADRIWTVDE